MCRSLRLRLRFVRTLCSIRDRSLSETRVGEEMERERGGEVDRREKGREERGIEGWRERSLVIIGAEIDVHRPRLESKRKVSFGVICGGKWPLSTGKRPSPVRDQKST
jgi:hypothetical protein